MRKTISRVGRPGNAGDLATIRSEECLLQRKLRPSRRRRAESGFHSGRVLCLETESRSLGESVNAVAGMGDKKSAIVTLGEPGARIVTPRSSTDFADFADSISRGRSSRQEQSAAGRRLCVRPILIRVASWIVLSNVTEGDPLNHTNQAMEVGRILTSFHSP